MNMKPDRITKLYDALTNKERAILSFHHLGGPDGEIQRILATVPRQAYEGPNHEYREWIHGITSLVSIWAIEHWQLRCAAVAAMSGASIARHAGDEARADKFNKQLWSLESYLLGLDRALEDVCNGHGIDAAAVRKQADTEPYRPIIESDKLIANPEYREELRARLSQLLPPRGPSGGNGTTSRPMDHCLELSK